MDFHEFDLIEVLINAALTMLLKRQNLLGSAK